MDEGLKQSFHGMPSAGGEHADEPCASSSFSGGFSNDSMFSSSSSDLTDDATSTSPNSAPPPPHASQLDSKGPLYELSSLMAQLPIKRGLSNYYQGKSQSFTCLSEVRCIEDLPKKETPYKRRMKQSKSYAGGLDGSPRSCNTPGPCSKTISKKTSRGSYAPLMTRKGSLGNLISRPPTIPVHKNI